MIPQVLLTGLGKVAFALLVGAVGVLMGTRVIARLAKVGSVDEALEKGNNAVAILVAGSIVSLGLAVQPATHAAFAALEFMRRDGEISGADAAKFIGYALGHATLSLVVGTIVIAVGVGVFVRLTKGIDEIAEIKKGNLAPAIVLASVMVVLAVLAAPGVEMALNGMLPIPPLPTNVHETGT